MKKETKEAYNFYVEAIARGENPKITDIAKRFNCDRTALAMRISRAFKKDGANKSTISENIESGFQSIATGITQIQSQLEDTDNSNELTKALINSELNAGFEYLDKFGYLGKYALTLLTKTLQKGESMLENGTNTDFEYQAVANGLKKTIETMGMFKTAPQIAIQNNLINGENGNGAEDTSKKTIDIKIDIVEPKKSDIVEAEVITDDK